MIETLLQKPCWVIDFLPEQVPPGGEGQFFAVERFYLRKPRQGALRRSFAHILLRVNCYYDVRVCEPKEEAWQCNPAPESLFSWITENKKDLCLLLPGGNTLFTLNRDDTHLTVYHPSEKLLKLLGHLSAGAGLFLWQPAGEGKA